MAASIRDGVRMNGRGCAMKIRRALAAILLGLVFAVPTVQADACRFQLGFETLRNLIPDVVGHCLDDEHPSADGSHMVQTTVNGRLVWSKASNWTGFTNGRHTWINGPQGLQRRPNTERFAWETATLPSWESRRLSLAQLLNGEYRLPLLDQEDPVRFEDGRVTIESEGGGATEAVHAGLVDGAAAFGDLDGDGIADAAAPVFIDYGGTGTFVSLVALLDRDGIPVQAARAFLGDRVQVERLSIARGDVFVTMLTHGPDDGLCCPSLYRTRTFRLHGDRLVPGRPLVVESPLPGAAVASGVEVRGRTSAPPPADGLAYLVYDERGGVIGMGRIPVTTAPGEPATFAAPVRFIAGAGGPGRIEIVDVHRHDGSALARTSVRVFLEASGTSERPPPRQIVLETPVSGAVVGTSVDVRGRVSVMPFEKNLAYRVYSEGGLVIGEGAISVEGEYGGPGTFATSIPISVVTEAGPVRIEVRDENEADGSLFTSVAVEVVFAGGL